MEVLNEASQVLPVRATLYTLSFPGLFQLFPISLSLSLSLSLLFSQGCIAPGVGEENVSTYCSLVHYHLSSPVFNETVKVLPTVTLVV